MSQIDLRLGRYQDVLADTGVVGAVISDLPYTRRVKHGFVSGSQLANDSIGKRRCIPSSDRVFNIPYAAITREEMRAAMEWAATVATWWIVIFNDHIGNRWALDDLDDLGWKTFAPVVWLKRDAPPRFAGEGPASSCEYIAVARRVGQLPSPRMGSRPGYYISNQQNSRSHDSVITGQKPVDLMRAIVRDYTLPGDLVADPFSGSGTTLIAAATEGRRGIGAELDPDTYAAAQARIAKGWTSSLFSAPGEKAEQSEMFG